MSQAIRWGLCIRATAAWMAIAPPYALAAQAQAAGASETCEPVHCEPGKSQSPIRIGASQPSTLAAPLLSYEPSALVLWNTGHSLQAEFTASTPPGAPDNRLWLDGTAFTAVQFHFHRPAEHVWGDLRPDMELHVVHRDALGNPAVVALAILAKTGAADQPDIAQLWAQVPGDGERRYLPDRFDLRSLTRSAGGRASFRYPGSLTTAPCSEGVLWSVFGLDAAIVISEAQLARYAAAFPHAYCRPLQDPNGRVPLAIRP